MVEMSTGRSRASIEVCFITRIGRPTSMSRCFATVASASRASMVASARAMSMPLSSRVA
jgi:hypothetical protein